MKNYVRAKSILLLLIFCTYQLLSCTQERVSQAQSVDETISNIKDRLNSKDYKVDKRFSNPFQHIKKQVKNVTTKIRKDFKDRKQSNIKRVSSRMGPNPSLSFLPVSTDENLSFGYDNPANLELLISTVSSYYQGSVSSEALRSYFSNINNILTNYSLSYTGADQFLNYGVSIGAISNDQKSILALELESVLNSSSINEIQDVINVVNSEVSNSQISSWEVNTIYYVNAGVEGAIEEQAIALNSADSNFKQTAAGAILAVVGLVIVIGAVNALATHYHCQQYPAQVSNPSYGECMEWGIVGSWVGVLIYEEVII